MSSLLGTVAVALLAGSPTLVAQSFTLAGTPAPQAVKPGDTFTFCISGYNSASTTGYILGNGQTATFGTTQTYTAAGYNGQNYTITSSETINGARTTDTFTVSTPTSFLTTNTVSGTTITQLYFEIGNADSGVGVATGANTVDFLAPLTNATSAGNVVYSASNTNLALAPSVALTNGNASLAEYEGVSSGTSAISGLAVHSFTFSETYDTVSGVPEPATLLGGALTAGLLGLGLRRRLLAGAV